MKWTLIWFAYFVRLAWIRLKKAFGLAIRGDKNFFAADAAWRLRTGRLPQGVLITCSGRSDGVGMQALSRISGLAFAATFGATYVHSKFGSIDHSNGDMAHWVAAWERALNLGDGEIALDRSTHDVVDYADYFFGRRELSGNSVLRFQQCGWIGRQDPEVYGAIAHQLRGKYGLDQNRNANRRLTVAIHVRRGDVTPVRNASRYTSDEEILASIARLGKTLLALGASVRLELFSEGQESDFHAFREAGCNLHISGDAVETMRRLVHADILLMSKSTFCYVAALISDGVKLYELCANPPLADWIVRRNDGFFDESALMKRLIELRAAEKLGPARTEDVHDADDPPRDLCYEELPCSASRA